MAVWTVTVAGVDRTAYVNACEWSGAINAIGTLAITFIDRTGTWIPEAQSEIVVLEDGAPKYRGVILSVAFDLLVRWRGVRSVCRASDVVFYAALELMNRIEAEGQTLGGLLGGLITNPLTLQGFTLDPAQVTGPTLGTLTAAWSTPFEFLEYLSKITGYVFRAAPSLTAIQLSMWALGSRTAPVALSQSDRTILAISGDVSVEAYRNVQWLLYGSDAERDVSDTFTGDGVTTVFPLTYALGGAAGTGGAQPGSVNVAGVDLPVGDYPGAGWTYRSSDNALVKSPAPTGAIVAAYRARFPQAAYVADAGEITAVGRRWVRKDEKPEIETAAEAADFAAALIRQNAPKPKRLRVVTLESGCDPGERITVNVAKLGISGDFYIEHVSARLLMLAGAKRFVYTLTLFDGGERPEGWIDLWKRASGGGGSAYVAGGVSGSSGGGSASSGVSGPFYANLGGSTSRGVQHASTAATQVKPIVVCVETGATVGSGVLTSSSAWEPQSFEVTLVSGGNTYRLRLEDQAGNKFDAPNAPRVPMDATRFVGVVVSARVEVKVSSTLGGMLGIGGVYA